MYSDRETHPNEKSDTVKISNDKMHNENALSDTESSYRWVVLALFIMIALISQALWLTFAPISSEMSAIFNVSAFDISLLSAVWPFIFVICAIPVGIFIDTYGFKASIGIGALCLAGFAVLRIFSTYADKNFMILLISQSGAAISQPFIFGSITKLAVSWFPEKERGLATGLGTIGLFLGMMIALVLTPVLYNSFGLRSMLIIYALLSCVGAFLFLLFGKERKVTINKSDSSSFSLMDLLTLSRVKSFLILEYGFFAVVGGFTAIMTWIEEILKSLHGLTIDEAGIVGGLMILGGIIGSIVIPTLSDKLKKIKPFVVLNLAIGTIALFLIKASGTFLWLSIVFFITGFFLMSALPLVLEISSRIAGRGMEGRSSSLLWFFSQVGSLVLIAMVDPIKQLGGDFYYPIMLIGVLWALSFFLFIFIQEPKAVEHT